MNKHRHGSPQSHGRETRVSSTPQRLEIRRNADGSRTISGTAVVFGALSEDMGFRERIAPGAFSQSLKDHPNVLILAQHDMAQPLGSVESGTAKVWQDDRGVQFTCKLPDTSWADDLASLISDGIVRSMSFGFSVPPGGDDWTTQSDGTTLRTVNTALLYECSVVTAPAYAQTSVSLRSAPAHIREQIRAKRAADEKTKTVDAEVLTADCFIIVGDLDDPETWHLPWKFSTEEKTKAHLRDALARFSELKGLSDEVLKTAWKRLLALCKQHDIDVSSENGERGYFGSIKYDLDDDDDDDSDDSDSDGDAGDSDGTEEDDPLDFCQCRCGECRAENCDGCSLCEDDEMCNECAAFQERQRKQRESERSMYLDLIMRRL
jgi:HK97 family phage prohead protease